ncbi:MAG: hypothetical protein WC728_01575 [Elusimicrobiota bacterium]
MRSLAQPRRLSCGPLRAVQFAASEGAPTVLCLHGYGADGADLASLATQVDLAGPAQWIFPDAPVELDGGRAWFPIPEDQFALLQLQGRPLDLSGSRPAGLDEARTCVEGVIAALGVPMGRLVLGGFSQGAMVALETALRCAEPPAALFLLSCGLCDEQGLRARAPGRAGLRVLQSHGSSDPLLSFDAAKRLSGILTGAGLECEFMGFDGGHAIGPGALERLGSLVDAVCMRPAD